MPSTKSHNQIIHITIDDREINCPVAQVLQRANGVKIKVKRLPLGDYEIDNKVLFERKTLSDLVASIKDGRLFRQACRLSSGPLKSVFILEGTARDLVQTKMRREAIQGALITISIILGIPLLRSRDHQETARIMLYTANQLRQNKSCAFPRHSKRPKGKRKLQLHILQGLPGIGPQRADCLLKTFGSVEAVFTAEVSDLIKVPGIGKHLAELIRWAIS